MNELLMIFSYGEIGIYKATLGSMGTETIDQYSY